MMKGNLKTYLKRGLVSILVFAMLMSNAGIAPFISVSAAEETNQSQAAGVPVENTDEGDAKEQDSGTKQQSTENMDDSQGAVWEEIQPDVQDVDEASITATIEPDNLRVRSGERITYKITYSMTKVGTVYVQMDPKVTKEEAAFDVKALEQDGYQIITYSEDNILTIARDVKELQGSLVIGLDVLNMKDQDVLAPSFKVSVSEAGLADAVVLTAADVLIMEEDDVDERDSELDNDTATEPLQITKDKDEKENEIKQIEVADKEIEQEEITAQGAGSGPDYYVKALEVSRIYSGTGPWDDDNDAGNDMDDKNDIIRSFDSAIYTTTYAIEPKNGVRKVIGGTLNFEAILPVKAEVATWDLSMMSWLKDAQVVENNGQQILTGTLPINNMEIPLAPRIGALNWGVQVGAVINGTQIPAPTFKMWAEDAKGEVAVTGTGTKELTVSAKANLDAQIKYEGQDDSKRAKWSVSLMLLANKAGKGIRGQELPDTSKDIKIDIATNLGQEYVDAKKNNKVVPGIENILQPSDYGAWVPYDAGADDEKTTYNKVYNGGTIEATKTGDKMQISVCGYKFDPALAQSYVTHNAGQNEISGASYTRDRYNFASFIILTKSPSGYSASGAVAYGEVTGVTAQDVHGNVLEDGDSANNKATYGVSITTSNSSVNTMYGPSIKTYPYLEGSTPDQRSSISSIIPSEKTTAVGSHVFFYQNIYSENMINRATYGGRDSFQIFTKFNGDIYEPIAGQDNLYGNVYDGYETYTTMGPAVATEVQWTSSDITRCNVQDISEYMSVKFVAKAGGQNWKDDDEMKESHLDGSSFVIYDTAQQMLDSNKVCVGFYIEIKDVKKWSLQQSLIYGGIHICYNTPLLNIKTSAAVNPSTGALYALDDANLVGISVSDVAMINGKGTSVSCLSTKNPVSSSSRDVSGTSTGYADYVKPTYDSNGNQLKVGSSNVSWYGNSSVNAHSRIAALGGASFYIRSYQPVVEKKVSQDKSTFNLDVGQRQVDYEIYNAGTTKVDERVHNTDTLIIKDTFPKGMNPYDKTVTGTATEDIQKKWNVIYGGSYKPDSTTNGGAGGVVEQGDANPFATKQWQDVLAAVDSWYNQSPSYTLTETANGDGSTTLTWTFKDVPVGFTLPVIHCSGIIGTKENIFTDVSSGEQLLSKVTISSQGIPLNVSKEVSITTAKVVGSTLIKKADYAVRSNEECPIAFNFQFSNDSLNYEGGVSEGKFIAIDVLPYEGDGRDSSDLGNYYLNNWEMNVRNLKSGESIVLYYTTDEAVKDKTIVPFNGTTSYPFDSSTGINWKSVSFADTDFDVDGKMNSIAAAALAALSDEGKITAIGVASEGLQELSAFELRFVYDWEDEDEKEEHQLRAKANNIVEYGMDGVTASSEATSNPEVPVTVVKSSFPASGSKVAAGGNIQYSLTATNSGSSVVPFTVIRDYIPEGTTYVSGSASAGGVYVAAGNYVEWVIQDLDFNTAAGQNIKTVSFDVTVDDNPGKTIDNVGLYDQFNKDPGNAGELGKDPAKETNQTVCYINNVDPVPALVTVNKSSDPVSGSAVKSGDTINYTLAATNTGGEQAPFTVVRDYIPEGATYVADSISSIEGAKGSFVNAAGSSSAYVEWVVTNLLPGEIRKLTFRVTVDDDAPDKIKNVGLYDTPSNDPGKPGNIADVPGKKTNETENKVKYVQPAVTKKVDKKKIKEGDNLTFTIVVANEKDITIKSITVKDLIPEYTTYVSSKTGTYYGDVDEPYIEWFIDELKPGQSVELVFTVKTDDCMPPDHSIKNTVLYEANGRKTPQTMPEYHSNTVTTKVEPTENSVSGNDGKVPTGVTRSNLVRPAGNTITSGNPKTGDDKNIWLYVIMIVTAVCVISGGVVYQKKKLSKK